MRRASSPEAATCKDFLQVRQEGGRQVKRTLKHYDELLARIRDIRASEKLFYKKVLDIYALSIDYDPHTESSQRFFAAVQNKMHWAALPRRSSPPAPMPIDPIWA